MTGNMDRLLVCPAWQDGIADLSIPYIDAFFSKLLEEQSHPTRSIILCRSCGQ